MTSQQTIYEMIYQLLDMDELWEITDYDVLYCTGGGNVLIIHDSFLERAYFRVDNQKVPMSLFERWRFTRKAKALRKRLIQKKNAKLQQEAMDSLRQIVGQHD